MNEIQNGLKASFRYDKGESRRVLAVKRQTVSAH